MTKRPTRATPGGRAYLDLRKAASAAGRPTDELLQLHALEGLLDRLSGSPHANRFVLKGGVLLAAFDARRPTRDVDLAAVDLTNDVDDIRTLVNEILAVDRDDGLEFDPTATTAATIRDDDLYGASARRFTAASRRSSSSSTSMSISVIRCGPVPRRSTFHVCSAGHRSACAATASS